MRMFGCCLFFRQPFLSLALYHVQLVFGFVVVVVCLVGWLVGCLFVCFCLFVCLGLVLLFFVVFFCFLLFGCFFFGRFSCCLIEFCCLPVYSCFPFHLNNNDN